MLIKMVRMPFLSWLLKGRNSKFFNDQTDAFLIKAQDTLRFAMGFDIKILTPLRNFYKQDVVALAKEKKDF